MFETTFVTHCTIVYDTSLRKCSKPVMLFKYINFDAPPTRRRLSLFCWTIVLVHENNRDVRQPRYRPDAWTHAYASLASSA